MEQQQHLFTLRLLTKSRTLYISFPQAYFGCFSHVNDDSSNGNAVSTESTAEKYLDLDFV